MITLGTRIIYTHQAAVARLKNGKWHFPRKGNGEFPRSLVRHGEGYVITLINGKIVNVPAVHIEPASRRPVPSETLEAERNKSVMAWEECGSGVVCGLVTKQVGKSHSGGSYEEDYGWFHSYGNVSLYVVRHDLKGSNFVYVPLWAAKPMDVKEET
jgi:hypothetical protein